MLRVLSLFGGRRAGAAAGRTCRRRGGESRQREAQQTVDRWAGLGWVDSGLVGESSQPSRVGRKGDGPPASLMVEEDGDCLLEENPGLLHHATLVKELQGVIVSLPTAPHRGHLNTSACKCSRAREDLAAVALFRVDVDLGPGTWRTKLLVVTWQAEWAGEDEICASRMIEDGVEDGCSIDAGMALRIAHVDA